ncbi:MAG TPA: trigger factor [Candidatus Didemnitutus sp.]|nr:trigger factor [Candidatus Didemnitutus sp.]
MNVQTTDINETRKALTVTLDKGEVDGEYKNVLGQFTQQASLPGFRPGRAPANLIERKFGKELREEFKGRVVSKAYREGLEQSKLDVVSLVEVEEGAVEPGTSAAIKLTVDIRPEFTVPEYNGIPTELPTTEPTDAEIDAIIEGLRTDRADFKVADRPAAKGDYVRFGYEGTLDGKPLTDVVGDKALYAKAPQTWEEVEGANEGVLPGVSKQIAGLKAGDKSTVTVTFPADFAPVPALAGKTVSYAIDVQEVRARELPPLDEKFFKDNQVENLDGLKEQVKKTLAMRKEQENRATQRRLITDALLAKASFPAPESLMAGERDSILRQFIEENMRRGVPAEQFEKDKKELFESATRAATGRVKIQLMLGRIAEAEKLKVDEKDLNQWLMREAMRSGQRPDKVAKDLGKDREQLRAIQQQLLYDKTLDFLASKATVTTAKPNA